MDSWTQAKLYYLFMMADGEVSAEEKKLFTTICKQLDISAEKKESIIKECENIKKSSEVTVLDVIKNNTKCAYKTMDDYLPISRWGNTRRRDKATVFWNLINLGYKDGSYSEEEQKIVDFLRMFVEFDKNIILEMAEIAETMVALSKNMEWIGDTIQDESYKKELLKKSKKELKYLQESVNVLISEID